MMFRAAVIGCLLVAGNAWAAGGWDGPVSPKVTVGDVRTYGARCDGTTDDTTAIQNALNASKVVFIPPLTCLVGPLTVALDDTLIYGVGTASVLQFKTASTGRMIDFGTKTGGLLNVQLYGGSAADSSLKTCGGGASAADRSACALKSQKKTLVKGVTIHGFQKYGIETTDTATDRLNHLIIEDVTIYNTWKAIHLITDYAEYVRIDSPDLNNNCFAIEIGAGNALISNAKVNDNAIGVKVRGTGIANDGHGTFSGGQINHSANYGIWCDGADLGYTFTGTQIHDSQIFLSACTGMNIIGGEIGAFSGGATFVTEAGGVNVIKNNLILSSPTITHNLNSYGVFTLFEDNRYAATGKLLDFCSDAAGAAACGGSTDGAIVIDAAATSVTLSTWAITSNQTNVEVYEDPTLGGSVSNTLGNITCNTAKTRHYTVTTKTPSVAGNPGTQGSVVITSYDSAGSTLAPVTNPACLRYRAR